MDARPSDGIAIALRTKSPLFAAEPLLVQPVAEEEPETEGFLPPPTALPPRSDELTPEQLKRHLEGLRPEDFGKFNP